MLPSVTHPNNRLPPAHSKNASSLSAKSPLSAADCANRTDGTAPSHPPHTTADGYSKENNTAPPFSPHLNHHGSHPIANHSLVGVGSNQSTTPPPRLNNDTLAANPHHRHPPRNSNICPHALQKARHQTALLYNAHRHRFSPHTPY